MFTDGSGRDGGESENLLIFSFSRRNRDHAAEIVQDRVRHHERVGDRPPMDRGGPPMGGGYGYGGPPMRDNMCWDFQKGRCTRGAMCRFSHGEPPMGGGGYNQGYGGGGGRGRSRSRSRDRNRDRGRRRRDDSSSRSRSRGRRRRRD